MSILKSFGKRGAALIWPVILPIKITCGLLVFTAIIAGVLKYKQQSKRANLKFFAYLTVASIIMFIPSCMGVQLIVDQFRFGSFSYKKYEEIKDFRIYRWMPTNAKNLQLFKRYSGNGYLAHYEIEESKIIGYVNNLWEKYGDKSASERSDFKDEGKLVKTSELGVFTSTNWKIPAKVKKYYTPRELDGGGAIYYFDPKTSLVLQNAVYW